MDEDKVFEKELELEALRTFKEPHYEQMNEELQMWRIMFLDQTLKTRYAQLEKDVRFYFLKASSDHIKEKSPLGCLNDIEKIFINGLKTRAAVGL